MSELEEMVRIQINAAESVKLKQFDEPRIAVDLYYPTTEEQNKLLVQAFQGIEEDFPLQGRFRVRSLAGTERKFKKKDRKIAWWYFKKLSRMLKNGIFIQENPTPNQGGEFSEFA